jgi:hypothetical protein
MPKMLLEAGYPLTMSVRESTHILRTLRKSLRNMRKPLPPLALPLHCIVHPLHVRDRGRNALRQVGRRGQDQDAAPESTAQS